METPSSARILTRSQARAALSNSATHNTIPVPKNGEETEKKVQASRPKDRCVLIDISNDSPIVGLAAGKSSSALFPKSTPGSGSGEALLRGQVKSLLQKIEEEAQISGFLASIKTTTATATTHSRYRQFLNSPMGILLAPTPANTPQIPGSAAYVEEDPLHLFTEYPIEDLFDRKLDDDKSLITRSLFLDFSEKSDLSTVEEDSAVSECSSVMTYQREEEDDDDDDEDASVWSTQVNASTRGEDDEVEVEVEVKEEEEFVGDESDSESESEYESESGVVDELCEGMSKMSVGFEGKHTRFVYNSEGEMEGEVEVSHLRGVPVPEGKHLHFDDDEEDDA